MSADSSRRLPGEFSLCSAGSRRESALNGRPTGMRIAARRTGPTGRSIDADTPATAGMQANLRRTFVRSLTRRARRRRPVDALS